MKTTDLRIGNLVSYKNEDIVVVDAVSKDFILTHGQFKISTPNIEPIPLTEQWLLDFGFEVEREHYDKGRLSILLADNNNDYYKNGRVFYKSWAIMESQPKYVHQLQNLYLALTQKELIIK